ncbi:MAG: hypothetical protein Kapaf2KO_12390 [Candidatus Kapaibacteriales bacterium]
MYSNLFLRKIFFGLIISSIGIFSASCSEKENEEGDVYETMAYSEEAETLTLNQENTEMANNIYDFEVTTLSGESQKLSDYSGKVLLIVNTASECGYTPQYEGLQKVYEQYKEKGFEVLAFPCNQFGGQEPGTSDEIANFCTTNYSVTFPMFEKIEVNGENEHPLYSYLKSSQSGLITDAIKWNFTKFLIDKNGKPVDRYAPQTKPESITEDIEELLGA